MAQAEAGNSSNSQIKSMKTASSEGHDGRSSENARGSGNIGPEQQSLRMRPGLFSSDADGLEP